MDVPALKGTLKTKLSGSMECWSTARLYHEESIALAYFSANGLNKGNVSFSISGQIKGVKRNKNTRN